MDVCMRWIVFFGGLLLPIVLLGEVLFFALGDTGFLISFPVAVIYGWNYDRIYEAVTRIW